jgi:hypothetical protein
MRIVYPPGQPAQNEHLERPGGTPSGAAWLADRTPPARLAYDLGHG